MKKSIGGLIFDTERAQVLARSGDGDVLYLTQSGRYFRCSSNFFLPPDIIILSTDEAMHTYNRCVEKLVGYREAFKDVEFREA
jgi:hypothetical protein